MNGGSMSKGKIEVRTNDEFTQELDELIQRSRLNISSQIRLLVHQEHERVFGPKPIELRSRVPDVVE
jgi:hypothetical protein